MLIVLYLVAIVAANLSVTTFGPSATIINALVLVAFDLTARDSLHEAWHGRQLRVKMAALIVTGSLLSYAINVGSGRIALASFMAFGMAGFADAIVYQLLGDCSRLLRINGSNIVSSVVDTAIFVIVAGLPLWVIPAQVAAKIIGGLVWSLLFVKFTKRGINYVIT